MINLDATIVSVALPVWSESFQVSPAVLQWVMTAYMLTTTGVLPALGGLSDRLGRKRFFLFGVGTFLVGSVLCALSASFTQLILFRVLQAVGGAMMVANVMSIITLTFPKGERGRPLGIVSSIVAAGTILGPAVGSFLLNFWGWRSIFWVNVPFGILSFLLVVVLLQPLRGEVEQRFDYLGSLFFFLGIVGVVLYLSNGLIWGWTHPWNWTALLCGVLFLLLFVWQEFRVDYSVVDPAFFQIPNFSLGVLGTYFSFLMSMFPAFLLPLYLDAVGVPLLHIGWLLSVQALAIVILAPLGGMLADRFSHVGTAAIGMGMQAVGMGLFSTAGTSVSYGLMVIALATYGAGLGLFNSPNNLAVVESLPPERSGLAGGLIGTMRNFGRATGVSVATLLLYAGMKPMVGSEALVAGTSFVFRVGMLIALFTALLTSSRLLFDHAKGAWKEGDFRG